MEYCAKIARQANAGQLVFSHNHDLTFGHSTWNTDLAIGPPPPGVRPDEEKGVSGMMYATPASTHIAVELKTVMTEHGKARKNRKRDLEAHHQHVHDYDRQCIAAGVIVVNASQTFKSPLRESLSHHTKSPSDLVGMVKDELSSVTMSSGHSRHGLDTGCLLAVKMDNVELSSTSFYEGTPAPKPGSPLHWDSFIQRLCSLYVSRY